jgi:hypothetical protein
MRATCLTNLTLSVSITLSKVQIMELLIMQFLHSLGPNAHLITLSKTLVNSHLHTTQLSYPTFTPLTHLKSYELDVCTYMDSTCYRRSFETIWMIKVRVYVTGCEVQQFTLFGVSKLIRGKFTSTFTLVM